MAYTTIDNPGEYFNTKLYTGNGSNRDITGVGFQPNFTWIKQRNGTFSHVLGNSVSGDNKFLVSSATQAESTDSDKFRTFVSDGFQVGTHNGVNGSSKTYVGWSWKESATAGFDIVAYTGNATGGRTVAHSLSAVPAMMIVKNRAASIKWAVYHKNNTAAPETDHLKLNSTDPTEDDDSTWNDTAPTSSVFSLGGSTSTNGDGTAYIAYLFADVKGYSKFGSYTGNGNANGTFVYTGFKPAWTLIKRTDSATGGSWILFDNKRGTNVINPVDVVMSASNNQSEDDWGTTYDCDYLSNGFKWRFNGSGGYNNASGGTYIYMAFAENPFVTSTGVPATAR